MPVYEIQAPNGKKYRIEGPAGATDAQVRQAVLQQHPDASQRAKAAPKAKQPSFGQSLMDSARDLGSNALIGAATLPDLASQYIAEPVSRGVGALARLAITGGGASSGTVGKPSSADRLADYFDPPQRQPAPTVRSSVLRLNPNAESAPLAVVEQMFGGAMVPIGPKGARPARVAAPRGVAAQVLSPAQKAGQQVVKDGVRNKVRVKTTDVFPPTTFIGKKIQSVSERIPFLGTAGERAKQSIERVDAVRNVMREYGAASGDDIAAPAIDDVMANFAKTRADAVARHATIKTAVINGTPGEVAVPNTIAALDGQIAKFSKVGTPAANQLVGKLQGWKESLLVPARTESTGLLDASGNPITRAIEAKGKSLSTIDLIRAEMGKAFKDPSLASIKDAGEKALQSIYGPMKTDMGTFIRTAGGPDKLAAWNRANVVLHGMADELNVSTLKSVLRSGRGTPEDVAKILFSNKPSLVRRLYGGLTQEGRTRAQAAILQRALEKSGAFDTRMPCACS